MTVNSSQSSRDRLLGTLGSADGKGVVRVEDRYATDIADLWSAVTEPERLSRWWGRVEGDLTVGGTFELEVQWQGTGRVIACEPPHRLVVIIRESDESYRKGVGAPPFDSRIEVTLTADGDHTILAIEVRGMEVERIAYYGAGWQIHAENLARYLAGQERDDRETRWDELVPGYMELAKTLAD